MALFPYKIATKRGQEDLELIHSFPSVLFVGARVWIAWSSGQQYCCSNTSLSWTEDELTHSPVNHIP